MTDIGYTDAFLRTDPADTLPAPKASTGIVGWLRTNLFSSVSSTILTVAAILLLCWVIPPLLRFAIFDAVWSGTSREACIAATAGHPVGACWPFIGERIPYFIYGQYPAELRWRVDLTAVLLVVGLIWLMVPRIGAKGWGAAYFFVAFPLAAFWLLSGGLGLETVPTSSWGGLLVTMVISAVGIVFSLPCGVLLALGRRSRLPVIRGTCTTLIEFVRGVPLITVLFMANVMLPLFLPPGWRPDSLLRVLIGVALFSSAYMAEVVRGGLQAMPRGQYEGAMALGLNYPLMMTFIIIPQALKLVIPGIVNNAISLFKDTSLVSIVGIFDLLKTIEVSMADPNWATPVTPITGFVFAAMVYWVFCFGMSRYSLWVERRLDTGHKR